LTGKDSRFDHLEMERAGPSAARAPTGRTFDPAEYVARALDQELSGDWDGAMRLYSRALSASPHLEEAWVGQLRCLVRQEDFHEAAMWAGKAMEYLPKSGAIVAMQAIARAGEGDSTEALALSDKALQMGGNSPVIWLARAWALGRDKEESASRCLRKAVETAQDDVRWLLEAGALYLRWEKYGAALEQLQRAATLRPALASAWYLIGLCRLKLGMLAEAEQALGQAVRLAPAVRRYREKLQEAGGVSWWTSLWRRIFRR